MAEKGDKKKRKEKRFQELVPPGQFNYTPAAWQTMWWSTGLITQVWLCATASSINLGFLLHTDT